MVGSRARPGKCVKSCGRCEEVVATSGAEETQAQRAGSSSSSRGGGALQVSSRKTRF